MSSEGDTSNGNITEKEKNDALYENRKRKKIVRIITVTAYMFSVSFVGIVLSAYYIFLWHPPNPRMMHVQAMSVHTDAQVDFLVETSGAPNRVSRLTKLPKDHSAINIFRTQHDSEKTKTRREIMKNVNAVLRANFEKAKSSESPLQETDHIINNTTFSFHNKENSVFKNNTLFTISEIGKILKIPTQKSLTNVATLTSTSTMASSTRRSKNPGKKQHQTPFALKHLEVPIKQDESKRRSTYLITTSSTTRMLPTTSNSKEISLDKIKPLSITTKFLQKSEITNSQEYTVKNFFRTLTTPLYHREDEPGYTDLPELLSISSDQFESVQQVNGQNYPDSTINPED